MLTGQRINQNHVTADFPIPFIISAGGNSPYGIYIDNTSNLIVDIGMAVLNFGTGQKILRVEVTDGCADISVVKIERMT